jgi:uncharacterized protein (UPF0332 family)
MRETEVSDQAIASRLYYASYHAAKAALFDEGFDPRGHGGLISLFGEELMDGERITRDDAKFLSRSQSRREQADYEKTPVEEDIDDLIQQTQEFVEKMKNFVN